MCMCVEETGCQELLSSCKQTQPFMIAICQVCACVRACVCVSVCVCEIMFSMVGVSVQVATCCNIAPTACNNMEGSGSPPDHVSHQKALREVQFRVTMTKEMPLEKKLTLLGYISQ